MSENFFDKKDFNERDGENRDGYSPDNNRPAGGGYNRREGGMRPRFSGRTEGGRTYVSSRYPSEGNRGYRPRYTRVNTEGEGATGRYGENSGNYSQRSHNAYAHSEGYRPRGGYQRSENPWGKRRSYNAGAIVNYDTLYKIIAFMHGIFGNQTILIVEVFFMSNLYTIN